MSFLARRISWRRWLRMSVRGLIVLVLVTGAVLGWIVRGARIQQDAVAAIKGARGSVVYDFEMPNGRYNPAGKLRAPRRLVELVGIDNFSHVVDVRLYLQPPAAASDILMTHVGRLAQIERLTVLGRFLTDSGMASLAGLSKLSTLDLSYSNVSDAGLAHVQGLTELSSLDLTGSPVSNEGVAHLKGLTKLLLLDLRSTKISDGGLTHLEGLQNLRVLHLASTPMTDLGLAQLKGLRNLTYLNVRGTRVSDAGLVHLKSLTNLVQLNLDGTQVTKDGMKSLQRSLPQLTIYHPRAREQGDD